MASDGNGTFSTIQRKIEYEGRLDEARWCLDVGKHEEAISAAERARGYLEPGSDASEVDAVVSSARAAMSRIEQDKREAAARAEAEHQQAVEQERLAQEQAAERRRQEERKALQDRQRDQKEKQVQKRLVKVLVVICIIGAGAFGVWSFLQKQHVKNMLLVLRRSRTVTCPVRMLYSKTCRTDLNLGATRVRQRSLLGG